MPALAIYNKKMHFTYPRSSNAFFLLYIANAGIVTDSLLNVKKVFLQREGGNFLVCLGRHEPQLRQCFNHIRIKIKKY